MPFPFEVIKSHEGNGFLHVHCHYQSFLLIDTVTPQELLAHLLSLHIPYHTLIRYDLYQFPSYSYHLIFNQQCLLNMYISHRSS
jgi:hypothetical protein